MYIRPKASITSLELTTNLKPATLFSQQSLFTSNRQSIELGQKSDLLIRTKDAIEGLQDELAASKHSIDRLKRAYERKCFQLKEAQAEAEAKGRQASAASAECARIRALHDQETAALQAAVAEKEDNAASKVSIAARAEERAAELRIQLAAAESKRNELLAEKAGLEVTVRALTRDLEQLRTQHVEQTRDLEARLQSEMRTSAQARQQSGQAEAALIRERTAAQRDLAEQHEEWKSKLQSCAAGWASRCRAIEDETEAALQAKTQQWTQQFSNFESEWLKRLESSNKEWADRFDALGNKWIQHHAQEKVSWDAERVALIAQGEKVAAELQANAAQMDLEAEHWKGKAHSFERLLLEATAEAAARERALEREAEECVGRQVAEIQLDCALRIQAAEKAAQGQLQQERTDMEKKVSEMERKADKEEVKRKARKEDLLQCIADLQVAAKADFTRREELERNLKARDAQMQGLMSQMCASTAMFACSSRKGGMKVGIGCCCCAAGHSCCG